MIPLLRNMIAMVHSLPVPGDDDLLHESAVNIIIARGVAAFNACGWETSIPKPTPARPSRRDA
jgi:hypothetical protein